MNNYSDWMKRFSFASLVILCLAVFTSLSVSAAHHILLVIPGIYFLQKKPSGWNMSMKAVALICATIAISVIFNWGELNRPLKNLSSMKYFLIPLIGVFAYRQVEWTKTRIKLCLTLLLLGTSVATFSGIIGLYSGFNPLKMKDACHTDRACGLYGMYMTYGYGIGLFMVIMTGLVIYRDQVKQYVSERILWSVWIINGAGLFLSYARGAWLGFLIALPFFFLKRNKKIFVASFLGGAIFLAALVGISPTVNKMFFERGGSNEQRLSFFESAYVAFKERPVVGWGYKNFEPNVKMLKAKYDIAFPDFQGHAHNNFLEHLASTGAVGFIALLLFHAFWFKESLCSSRLIDNIALPFVVALFVSGMTQVTLGDGENLFLIMGFWLVCQVQQRPIHE
tara:strand:+ start:18645 stop:19826 length:1182 start_codon:yes stop_codon:yes gene_type:complete